MICDFEILSFAFFFSLGFSTYSRHRLLFKWPICHFSISYCWWNGTSGSSIAANSNTNSGSAKSRLNIVADLLGFWLSDCAWMCDSELIDSRMNTSECSNAITFSSLLVSASCVSEYKINVTTIACAVQAWPLLFFLVFASTSPITETKQCTYVSCL